MTGRIIEVIKRKERKAEKINKNLSVGVRKMEIESMIKKVDRKTT